MDRPLNPAPESPGPPGQFPPFPGGPPVRGDSWTVILGAYCLYVLVTFLNDAAGGGRQAAGAMVFLAFVTACFAGRLFPLALSPLTVSLLLAALGPLAAALVGVTLPGGTTAGFAVKYYALLFLILGASSLRLPPLYRAPERWWPLGVLVFVLLLGLVREVPEERVEGAFVNPNNYALAALSLLFFVDHERDRRGFIAAMHVLVVLFIVRSGTTGALLGYLAGVGAGLLRTRYARYVAAALVALAVLAALLPGILRPSNAEAIGQMRFIGPIWTKLYVTREYYGDLAAGGDINFWEVGTEIGGAELTSSLWRLSQWRESLWIFDRADLPRQWLGHGLGSSYALMEILPHNDYLRLLLETGWLGLAANLAVWICLYRAAPPAARWPAVAMAIYAISENNLDNFLVMSLFALFLVGTGAPRASPPPWGPPEPEAAP